MNVCVLLCLFCCDLFCFILWKEKNSFHNQFRDLNPSALFSFGTACMYVCMFVWAFQTEQKYRLFLWFFFGKLNFLFSHTKYVFLCMIFSFAHSFLCAVCCVCVRFVVVIFCFQLCVGFVSVCPLRMSVWYRTHNMLEYMLACVSFLSFSLCVCSFAHTLLVRL